MKFLVAQIGARRHYAVPLAFHQANMLERLVTDASGDIFPWSVVNWLPASLRRGALERIASRRTGLPIERIRGVFIFTLFVHLGPGRRKPGEDNISLWLRRNRQYGELVVRAGLSPARAIYVFNGAGLEILREAARSALFRVLDQTSAPMRWDARLLTEEATRWPEWLSAAEHSGNWLPMAEREEEEWRLAERIICGSNYVKDSVQAVGGPVDKCRVVPYGYAIDDELDVGGGDTGFGLIRPEPPAATPRLPGKLRVLFAGTLSLRKGIPYLYEAIRLLKSENIEWRFVGPSAISPHGLARLKGLADVRGPVPRSGMPEHYRWADVLVLPSISEGSANVCYEALGNGVSVITTPNCGSVVQDGINGFIVPIRSPEALAEKLESLVKNPEMLGIVSESVKVWKNRHTGTNYAENLVRAVADQR